MSASITRRSSGEWVWQFTATVIRRSWHCLPSCSGRRGREEREGREEGERKERGRREEERREEERMGRMKKEEEGGKERGREGE